MNAVRSSLLILGVLLLTSLNGSGQQTQDVTVIQLKEQIQRLLAVDRDEATPTEVKQLNRRFIAKRRIQLRALMEKNLDSLRKYLLTVGSSLEAAEKQIVQNRIKEAESDLQVLDKVIQENPSSELSSGETTSSVASSSSTFSAQGSTSSGTLDGNIDGDGDSSALPSTSGLPVARARTNPNGQNPPQNSTSLNATLNARIRAKTRVEQRDNTKQTE